jgi:hypothetical protein
MTAEPQRKMSAKNKTKLCGHIRRLFKCKECMSEVNPTQSKTNYKKAKCLQTK